MPGIRVLLYTFSYELSEEITEKKNATKKAPAKEVSSQGQAIRAGDQGIALRGDVTDSTIIHAQTVVLADRFWKDLQPSLPTMELKEATKAYLAYLNDRHFYLSLKGMGVSDRVPLRLKLLDLYVPLKARIELPEGETWKRDLSLAGRDVSGEEQEDTLHLGEPAPLIQILQNYSGFNDTADT